MVLMWSCDAAIPIAGGQAREEGRRGGGKSEFTSLLCPLFEDGGGEQKTTSLAALSLNLESHKGTICGMSLHSTITSTDDSLHLISQSYGVNRTLQS